VLPYQIGDLVHIPQAVKLLWYEKDSQTHDRQLPIPLAVEETQAPQLGIVTELAPSAGYVNVYSQGKTWTVKNDNIYVVKGST